MRVYETTLLTFYAIIGGQNIHNWGKFAAARFVAKRSGCNNATAKRLIEIVQFCERGF